MNETLRICPKCGTPVPAEAPQGLCPKCVMAGAATPSQADPHSGPGEPPPVETIAAAFPQLDIVELIGVGGMGAVYKARQPKLERWVALKILPETLAADPAFAERFSREARMLARLNHPSIVGIYDFGQGGGFFYLLMEFVDGVNLRDAMAAGRFTPSQALSLVPRICEALQYAHDEGILHRDIKPENILLDVKGRVKIADFGIAKVLGDRKEARLTASRMAVGTPHYMAPEQLEHPQEVDQRADIYSLGVVFYEMLTGELPIGRFAPPSAKSPVDPRVDEVVLRTLEKEPAKRQHSAGEVKTQVENISSTPANTAAAAAPAPPAAGSEGASKPVVEDLAAAVPQAAGGSAAAQPLWIRWYAGHTPGQRRWIGIVAWVAALAGLTFFVSFHYDSGSGMGADRTRFEMGVWDPWYVRTLVNTGQKQAWSSLVNVFSASFLAGCAGLQALLLALAWRRWERRQTPSAHGGGLAPAESQGPATARMLEPNWSRKAVVAAVLSGTSLVFGFSVFVVIGLFIFFMPGGGGWFGRFEILLLVPLAILSGGLALAGLILGGVARREITDSQGRLRGAGLALFAMLVLPVEAVGSLLLYLCLFGLMTIRVTPHIQELHAPVTETLQAERPRPVESANPSSMRPKSGTEAVQPAAAHTNAPPQSP